MPAPTLVIDGLPCEYIQRRRGEMMPPPWPVCTWDGSLGENIARSLDGTRWYRCGIGYYLPQPWERIATPAIQPAVRTEEDMSCQAKSQ